MMPEIQVSENGFNISWEIVEKENLVSKLKFLTLLDAENKFKSKDDSRLEDRIPKMLNFLPNKYHTAALAVLSNVFYITEQMLIDAMRSLWYQYTHDFKNKDRIGLPLSNVHIFELDQAGARDSFFNDVKAHESIYGLKAGGRLDDKSPFTSVDSLLLYLHMLDDTKCLPYEELSYLYALTEKKHWILLVDISLSGVSVCNEIKRLKQIADHILKVNDLNISIFIQAATEEAQTHVDNLLAELNKSSENINCYYAIKIPYECAFNAKKVKKQYSLLKDKKLIKQVDDLCSYFAEHVVENKKYSTHITKLVKQKRDEGKNEEADNMAKYGFGGLGWNVITYKNAPNNSLPFLWCQPSNSGYTAPYERTDSRGDQPDGASKKATANIREWVKSLGFDGASDYLNQEKCEKIYEQYTACLAKYPDIERNFGKVCNKNVYVDSDVFRKKNRVDFVDSDKVIKNMAKSGEKVYLISCINYEERSIAFTKDIIAAYSEEGCQDNLVMSFWRLKSDRPKPWSLMEVRKDSFIESIKPLKTFDIEPVPWSDSNNTVDLNFIPEKIRKHQHEGYTLIVDLSAMPHIICSEFSKILANPDVTKYYKNVYIVHTSAKEYLTRKGLGPSHVGNIKLQPYLPKDTHVAMVFPGREGYEAALAISALKEKNAHITVAINLFDPNLLDAFEICYANQLVCSKSIKTPYNIRYYYSQQDLQRILAEFREHAKEVTATHVEFAIFDINWRIISVAFEMATFQEIDQISVKLTKIGDATNSNTHQYHNFYSKYVGLTNMFLVSEKSIADVRKDADEKRGKIKQIFDSCNVVVVDADDTIWHDYKYYSEYKESVFKIIKREKNISEIIFRNVDLDVKLDFFRDGSAGESAYAKAMTALCNFLQLSGKGLEEVQKLSNEFENNPSKLFKAAQKGLSKIKAYGKKCIVATIANPKDFQRKKAASGLDIDFDDVEFVKIKDEASWEKIHGMLKDLRPLYIGNSYKEDIVPNKKLGHTVIWFNHEGNYRGRKGICDERLLDDLIQVNSWVEILDALDS